MLHYYLYSGQQKLKLHLSNTIVVRDKVNDYKNFDIFYKQNLQRLVHCTSQQIYWVTAKKLVINRTSKSITLTFYNGELARYRLSRSVKIMIKTYPKTIKKIINKSY